MIQHSVTMLSDGVTIKCSCGAYVNRRKDHRRFLERHPKICNERKEFSRQLSRTTRSVDEDDRFKRDYEIQGKEW